jgi:hypothetical protein
MKTFIAMIVEGVPSRTKFSLNCPTRPEIGPFTPEKYNLINAILGSEARNEDGQAARTKEQEQGNVEAVQSEDTARDIPEEDTHPIFVNVDSSPNSDD